MTVTAPGARTASAATVKETVSEAPVGVAVDAGVAYGAEPIDLGSPSRETPENIEGSGKLASPLQLTRQNEAIRSAPS
jgi:hypothetical protein